jgi:hypothetical protein
MTYIKSFEEFVNESKLIKTETITHEIEYDIDRQFVSEGGFKSEEDMADTIANDVNLKSGGIVFESDYFEIHGQTMDNKHLVANQSGEFDMYGGPYEPKMKKPEMKLDGKDIYSKAVKAFKDYGWDSKEIDISRTDIWGSIVK